MEPSYPHLFIFLQAFIRLKRCHTGGQPLLYLVQHLESPSSEICGLVIRFVAWGLTASCRSSHQPFPLTRLRMATRQNRVAMPPLQSWPNYVNSRVHESNSKKSWLKQRKRIENIWLPFEQIQFSIFRCSHIVWQTPLEHIPLLRQRGMWVRWWNYRF